MNLKRVLKILLPCAAIVTAGVMTVAAASSPLTVSTVTLEASDVHVIYTEQGTSVFRDHIRVTAPMDGDIVEIRVREGDRVKAGDVIAVIDADDVSYQIRRLEQEIEGYNAQILNLALNGRRENSALAGQKNDLLDQRLQLESQNRVNDEAQRTREALIKLQADVVANDQANYSLAERAMRDYRRRNEDYRDSPDYTILRQAVNGAEKQLLASEQYLLDLRQETTAPGYYDDRRQSIDAQITRINSEIGQNYNSGLQAFYQSQIEVALLHIEQLQEKQGKAIITAAKNGVISTLAIDAPGAVSQGTEIAAIGAAQAIEVFVPVREVSGIAVGDEVTLTVSRRQGDLVCAGKVDSIGAQAVAMLSPLGVEESRVRVMVTDSSGEIGAGWQADIGFTVYQRENSIVLPQKAVFEHDGMDYVWLVEDETAVMRPVVTGALVVGGYIVQEGLESGDVIVSDANIQGIAEGRKLKG